MQRAAKCPVKMTHLIEHKRLILQFRLCRRAGVHIRQRGLAMKNDALRAQLFALRDGQSIDFGQLSADVQLYVPVYALCMQIHQQRHIRDDE